MLSMISNGLGKVFFRIPGPNEVDYGVESREIRSALTDYKYIGSEKRGMKVCIWLVQVVLR